MDDVALWILLFLGSPLWVGLLVTAVVALNRASAARRHADEVERGAQGAVQRLWAELTALKQQLSSLQAELAKVRALPAPNPPVAAEAAREEAEAARTEPVSEAAPIVSDFPAAPSPADVAPDVAAAAPVDEAPAPPANVPATSAEEPAAGPPPETDPSEPPAAAEPAVVAPPLAARVEPEATLEERIGLVWFTRIGALVLLLGVAYFFKYAVDSEWIGPSGPVALGVAAGVAALVFAEVTRARTKRVFTQAALGIGLSLLLVSAYASHAFYGIAPTSVAFAAVFVVTLLGGALAVRHRGQAILVFSSIAALVTPALLSTGQDCPLGLFGYVLLVTALTYVTSVRLAFRVAPWVGVVGSLSLFLGWYAKFFDVGSTILDVRRAGAYHDLDARLLPAAFVVLCAAEWTGIYYAARARKLEGFGATAYLVVATLFLHVGATMLFHDQPVGLGLGLAALGAGSVVLLRREKREGLLAIPLVASFLALVATSHQAAKTESTLMMAALALWASVYLVMLALPLRKRAIDTGTLVLLGVIGLFLGIIAAEVLVVEQPRVFSLYVVGGAALYAVLASAVAAPSLGAGAMALSLVFLLLSMPSAGKQDLTYVALSAAWAAVYFAEAAFELFFRKREATRTLVLLPSGAGIGFLALTLTHTTDRDGVLRAALVAAVGALDLALGAGLLRRGGSRGAASFLLAQSLAAFATAVAFLLSGASITIAWVALATVVMVLGARERDRAWLAGASVLFLVALLRLLAFDLPQPAEARELWIHSRGAAGALWPRAIVNERTLALVATAAGLFVGARSLSRSGDPVLRPVAIAPLVLGHLLTLLAVVLEGKRLLVNHADPPSTFLDSVDFDHFVSTFRATEAADLTQRAMVTTLLIGLYAAALVGLGFGRRSAPHRYMGLALFAVTLVKLGLWDVWNLPRIQQIGVLVGIGALLLGASFLYARFGKRLVTLLRDGAPPAAIFFLFFLGLPGDAAAADASRFEQSRTLQGVTAPGLHRFVEDADLWRATRSSPPFADLRIVDGADRELPYVRRPAGAEATETSRRGTLVDPVKLDGGGARAVLDLGPSGGRHDGVRLDLAGAGFARKTRVEVSADERDFHVIAEGGWVFRLEGASGSSSSTTIPYAPSDARYVRVSVLGGSDGRELRILGGEATLSASTPPPPMATMEVAVLGATRDTSGKGTSFVLDLGAASVPVLAVELSVETPVFERRASVEAGDAPVTRDAVGAGILFRVGRDAPAQITTREGLRIATSSTRARYFRVHVDDGDDPPLTLRSARVSWRPSEVVFRAEIPGDVTLLIGDREATAPTYDLGSVLARIGGGAPAPVSLGLASRNPRWKAPVVTEPPVPFTERHKGPLVAVILLVVLLLGGWAVVLLRSPRGDDDKAGPV